VGEVRKVAFFLRSPKWAGGEGVWALGRPLYGQNFLGPDQLRELFSKTIVQERIDPAMLKAILSELRGHFAIIWHAPRQLVLAADNVRTYPLFFTASPSEVGVSDHLPNHFMSSSRLSNRNLLEFAMTGFVSGSETMYKDVQQVQAGEALILDLLSDEMEEHTYFSFSPLHPKQIDDVHTIDRYINIIDQSMKLSMERLIHYLDGRTAVVPLSGGWDSRTILLQLLRLGYNDVLTFSYGKEGNSESQVSRQVAQKLGVRWVFIPYTIQKWRSFAQTREYWDYLSFAHNAVSVPHIQDLLAVQELLKQEVISPQDSVIVPGHSADFVAGSHLQVAHSRIRDVNAFVKALMSKHYILNTPKVAFDWLGNLFKGQNDEELLSRLRNKLVDQVEVLLSESAYVDPHAFLDFWNWRERQAKFIVNSVRVYEFYGLDFGIPLWDADFVDIWNRVPYVLRSRRLLFLQYLLWLQQEIGLSAPVAHEHFYLRGYIKDLISYLGLLPRARTFFGLVRGPSYAYNAPDLQLCGIWDMRRFSNMYYATGGKVVAAKMLALDILEKGFCVRQSDSEPVL